MIASPVLQATAAEVLGPGPATPNQAPVQTSNTTPAAVLPARTSSVQQQHPPPPASSAATDFELPTSNLWHYGRGRQFTIESVEFDRQLDHLVIWIEEWNHHERCSILEGLLIRSNFNQYQFLWTTLQPTLHRDFMYRSKKEFPESQFVPISTHATRQKAAKKWVQKYFRVQSAYIQDKKDVEKCNEEVSLPKMEKVEVNRISEKHQELINNYRSQWDRPGLKKSKTTKIKLPSAITETKTFKMLKKSQSAPAELKLEYLPRIRRHMQNELSPREGRKIMYAPVIHKENLEKSMIHAASNIKSIPKTVKSSNIPNIPKEGWYLWTWFEDYWNDVQRNEFLHKLIRKLDQRQLYFITSYLSLKQFRDFIELLPDKIGLQIMSYLTAKELVTASKVNKHWYKLANNNNLWKAKCQEVEIEIPIPPNAKWKDVYKDNISLKSNWEIGTCHQVELKGHTGKVLSVTFDGKRLASGSKDNTIKVWDIKSGNQLQTLKGHSSGIWCLKFFTKNLLISGSYDGTIRIWNLRTGTCARALFGHEGPIWSIARKHNLLASASQDKLVKLWDVSRCCLLHNLIGHTQAVFCVDIDEECTIVVTGSADRSIRVWSVETGKQIKLIWASQTTAITCLSYHKGYFACAVGEIISLWNLETASCIRTFEEHEKRVESLEIRVKDPKKLQGIMVSSGRDGNIKYWHLNRSKSKYSLQDRKKKSVNSIHFDETKIVSASFDKKVRIWDFSKV